MVLAAILAFGVSVPFAAGASAQSYPQKPIHIIVPYAPGGITDVIVRRRRRVRDGPSQLRQAAL
jgi:tripartite-type tricarboxylate transporter receptor subunit TctC